MATIPKLALIPSGYKAGKVYSVLPTSGVGDFTFTRASSATRINSSGLLETVATGVPRLEYPLIDGVVNGCPSLLLEPQATNLITYPVSFDNAYWAKSGATIDDNAGAGYSAPSVDFPTSAFKLVEGTNTGEHYISFQSDIIVASGATTTKTIYVKSNGRQWVRILETNLSSATAYFDIINGVLGTVSNGTATITQLTDGWFRCSFTTIGVDVYTFMRIHLASANGVISYTGDGTSGVYLFMAQLEAGSYATSPTLTSLAAEGTTTTRVAEVCNGAGNASTFNSSEGVLFAEIGGLVNNGESRRISINDGTATSDNRVVIEIDESTSTIKAFMSSAGATVGDLIVNGINQTQNNKIAVIYKANTFEIYINGFLLDSDYVVASLPIGLSELKFRSSNNTYRFYGKTKQLQYFDSALNDSDLETLTSWTSFTEMANGQTYSIK